MIVYIFYCKEKTQSLYDNMFVRVSSRFIFILYINLYHRYSFNNSKLRFYIIE